MPLKVHPTTAYSVDHLCAIKSSHAPKHDYVFHTINPTVPVTLIKVKLETLPIVISQHWNDAKQATSIFSLHHNGIKSFLLDN